MAVIRYNSINNHSFSELHSAWNKSSMQTYKSCEQHFVKLEDTNEKRPYPGNGTTMG